MKHLKQSKPQSLQDLLQPSQTSFISRPVAWEHTFYLGPVETPDQYLEWFDTIRNATQNDHIKIHINSPGGCYATALQFRRVLMETDAMVTCSIEGECHSAATIIYLSADGYSVSEGSSMLLHDYSAAAIGKGSEQYRQVVHEKQSIDAFLSDVYEGFLSKEEIKNVLLGQDLWLTADEIIERTEKLIEIQTKELEELQKQEEKAEAEEVKPKKTRSTKK